MRRGSAQPGSREVDPGQQTGRKRTPSDMARKARRAAERAAKAKKLMDEIHGASRRRQQDWRQGDGTDEFSAARRDGHLDDLHGDKRVLRREVLDEAPELDRPFGPKWHPGRAG